MRTTERVVIAVILAVTLLLSYLGFERASRVELMVVNQGDCYVVVQPKRPLNIVFTEDKAKSEIVYEITPTYEDGVLEYLVPGTPNVVKSIPLTHNHVYKAVLSKFTVAGKIHVYVEDTSNSNTVVGDDDIADTLRGSAYKSHFMYRLDFELDADHHNHVLTTQYKQAQVIMKVR